MADNVNVNPSGTTPIATDDVAGVQFQKVKVNLGTDGTDAGLVSNSNPFPIQDVNMSDFFNLLYYIASNLEFGINTDNAKRLKVNLVDSGALANVTTVGTVTTVSTVTTVGTVSDQTSIGGLQAKRQVEANMDAAFNTGYLANLIIS